jgi:hypothetical protein
MIPEFGESPTIEIPNTPEAGKNEEPGEPDRMPELRDLPREVGYVLLSVGVLGLVMPGPGTPAFIAGGLVLWPDRFGKAETWFKRRYPSVHRDGMRHIHRFLKDLENRYPGTFPRQPPASLDRSGASAPE